jgi:predicted nuclease of predicted toxin-antitoxin system
VRLIVDAQLPPALARWLTDQDEQAEHVADLGLLFASDLEIWRAAEERAAVIVSKDEDFALRAQLSDTGPPVVWVRSGNVRTGELLRRWSQLWPGVREALGRGERLVEIA